MKLLFVSKKMFSTFRDVVDMRCVCCFLLVLSSSLVFSICFQSDLCLDMAELVTFEKTLNFTLSVKKSSLKVFYFSRCRRYEICLLFLSS